MENIVLHWLLKILDSRDQHEIETQALKCIVHLVGLTLVFKTQKMSFLLPPYSGWTRTLRPISVHPLVRRMDGHRLTCHSL